MSRRASGDRTLRDILLGPGISCSDPGYPAPERDISLLGYPAPERDISLARYPARNQDISLARSARYPARERDIQGPSGISRFISLARYPAPERDISLRAGYLVPHRDIYRFGISRFWAGYLRIEISRSTSGVRISRKVRSPDGGGRGPGGRDPGLRWDVNLLDYLF